MWSSILSAFFLWSGSGILTDNSVVSKQQPGSSLPNFSAPIRNLSWGQINIIHTTDSHGWLPGHLLEPVFTADWGDLYSFVSHMKEIGKSKGVDVLFVDSGDRHDGNGLSDATSPNGILTENLFLYQDYDIITVGNHELYKYESSVTDYEILRRHFGNRYVVSNVDIFVNNTWVPMGNRYRRFVTENQKLNVIAFGFLFNFYGNNPLTNVTLVQDAVQQHWFQEAISHDDTDLFVIAAHIPVRLPFVEMYIIVNAIRKVHPNAAIQFLGGHSHVRDYTVLDKRATALESGRFLETIGWASVDGIDNASGNDDIKFSRTYIDSNLHSFTYHTGTTLGNDTENDSGKKLFDTPTGIEISKKIVKYRKDLNLDDEYGCVPRDLLLNRARYPGPNSFFSLLEDEILPRLIGSEVPESRSLVFPRYILINTGSIRFDLFKGPFTRDSGYIVSPFKNNWLYLPNVPLKYARKILPELNKLPYILATSEDEEILDHQVLSEEEREEKINKLKTQGKITTPGLPPRSYLDMNIPQSRALHYRMFHHYQEEEKTQQANLKNESPLSQTQQHQHNEDSQKVLEKDLISQKEDEIKGINLTAGYVTYDDIGCTGDDTIHDGWNFYTTPNAIQAEQNIPNDDGDTLVDVVFYDFIKPFLLDALAKIDYHNNTILSYGGNSTVELLTDHVTEFWSGKCQ